LTTAANIPGEANYWDHRFETGDTPWDIGHISPPLKAYANQLTDKNSSILIPGCGNSYEAEYLLARGFSRVTVIDISPTLTRRLEEKFSACINKQLHIITGNFFELQEHFDLILEQTFFCALNPALRRAYARKMRELLNPGGRLAGVLFNRSFTAAGPPFGGTMEEYRELFAPLFHIVKMEPCYNSVKPREGSECFFILEKEVDS
jgi:SAM-dependent methyltransferase